MNKQELCIKAYEKHKHLKLAGNEIGIPWQTVYVHLKQAGIPVVGDKSRYGSDSDRLAAKSEQDFIKYVPFANDQNRKTFQSKIDFEICGYGVDLKSARPKPSNKSSSSNRWCFSLKKQELCADFFVCFAYDLNAENIVHCILIPGELARTYTSISLSPTGKKWWDYQINLEELADFFRLLPGKPI